MPLYLLSLKIWLFLFILAVAAKNQNEGDSCVLESSDIEGKCKQITQCEIAKKDFLSKGIRPTFCQSGVTEQPVICCREGNSTTEQGNEKLPVWGSEGNDSMRVSIRKCEKYSSVIPRVDYIPLIPGPQDLEPVPLSCDYDSIPLIGGDNADPGQFPHMAAIGYLDSKNSSIFYCGGSLISERFVLTSGQCTRRPGLPLDDAGPSVVRLGDQNLDDTVDDGANPFNVQILRMHIHPYYRRQKPYHNLALLELAEDVTFKRDVRPACLWSKADLQGLRTAVATDWGEHVTVKNTTIQQLKRVVLSLMGNQECKTKLGTMTTYQEFLDSQLCAKNIRAQDACEGTLGSPLQVSSQDKACVYHIIGVTHIGRQCGYNQSISVFTRVSSYLSWIEKIVWGEE